jgi:signal peptidase II
MSEGTAERKKINVLIEIIAGIAAVAVLVFIDQYTKQLAVKKLAGGVSFPIIKDVLEFYFVKNQGAAWGILSGKKIVFIIITVVVMIMISYMYIKTPKTRKYAFMVITEITLFSGALGNFIDRIELSYVRDFIYFKLIDFPVFNIADIYVVLSAIALCILVMFVYKDEDFAFLKINKKVK